MFIVFLPLIAILIDIVIRQYTYNFWPSPSDILFKNSHILKRKIIEDRILAQNSDALQYNHQLIKVLDTSIDKNSDDSKQTFAFQEIQLSDKI